MSRPRQLVVRKANHGSGGKRVKWFTSEDRTFGRSRKKNPVCKVSSGRADRCLEVEMTLLMIAMLGLLMVATSFLSGIFGMAGGLILIGVLLALMPLPAAMVLHAITQMASNGWRAFLWRRHIKWRPVAVYLIGCALALGLWSLTKYVPAKPVALLILGITPFLARLLPKDIKPNPDS